MTPDSINQSQALGLDIGGSAIKYGRVDTAKGQLIGEARSLPLTVRLTPEDMTATCRKCITDFEWEGRVGIGYPGVVKNGVTLSAAHLDESFIGLDLLAQLSSISQAPMVLLNDADAAGLAEIRFGAASEHRVGTVLVVTLGTGIGSALFHNGKLQPNTELGHILLGDKEAEDLAAGAVKVRDDLSWKEYGRRLSSFLHEMERLLSTDLIVIGGGISVDYDRFAPYLKLSTITCAARFRNRAGLIGAALATEL